MNDRQESVHETEVDKGTDILCVEGPTDCKQYSIKVGNDEGGWIAWYSEMQGVHSIWHQEGKTEGLLSIAVRVIYTPH